MKRCFFPLNLLLVTAVAGADAPWHYNLELGQGGIWQRRVAVTVQNDSDQPLAGQIIELKVGKQPGQVALIGTQAQAIRACGTDGAELLYRLVGGDGKPITRGPVPEGAALSLPVEAGAKASATVYVYFDNPEAWGVADFLDGKSGKASTSATVGAVEAFPLQLAAAPAQSSRGGMMYRAPVRIINESPRAFSGQVRADASMMLAQLEKGGPAVRLSVWEDGKTVPATRLGDSMLFQVQVPARTVKTVYLESDTNSGAEQDVRQSYERVMRGEANLVKNPSFEGGDWSQGWSRQGGEQMGLDVRGYIGSQSARLQITKSDKQWTGFKQDVPVQPGHRYLYAAWVMQQGIEGGRVTLHAHWLKKDGKLSAAKTAMASAGAVVPKELQWALASAVLQAPPDAATLQLHLTSNTPGTIWYDGVIVTEVIEGAVGPMRSIMGAPDGPVNIWPVDAIIKVFKQDLPPVAGENQARISAARNEYEPLQLAIRSPRAIKEIAVAVEPPANAGGAKLAEVEVNVVGYVPIDHKTNYYQVDVPAWHRKIPVKGASCDGWPGWWPDPLLPRRTFDLEAESTQPIWITVHIPKDAPSGDYRGKVKLSAAGAVVGELPFVVHVWNFSLPDQNHIKAVYDARVGPRWISDRKQTGEMWRKVSAFMAQRRVCPDRISPEPVLKYEKGQVVADFTEFDKAAAEYFALGHTHTYTPHNFYGFGWAHPPAKRFGQEPYEGKFPYDDVDHGKLRPEYKRAYQACLKAYLDHMKAKGWYDKVLLYISDEPHYWGGKTWFGRGENPQVIAQMKALCEMIHEVDPRLPIYSSTWHHVPQWDGFITAWGIGAYGAVPVEKIRQIKQGGARVLFTTDGHMCTDTPYCAIERLLPHYCFKYGVEGYEFWGATWLTYDPYEFGWHSFIRQADKPGHDYYIRYPNGDGYLIYPGVPIGYDGPVSSVRLEQAREGVEDYEYLWLLRRRIDQAKAAGQDVSAAQKVLNRASELVSIPNSGGRFSTKLLPNPEAVAEIREAIGHTIETLK